MHTVPLRVFAAALLVLLAIGCTAPPDESAPAVRPLLWRISGAAPSYLYGTLHVPDPRVVALPDAVVRALDGSDVFCSEVPLDAESQQRMAEAALLPGGATLRQVLPADLYRRAAAYLAGLGVPLQPFERLNVWSLATLLSMADQLEALASQPSLDEVLYQRADRLGKRLDALETPDDQFAVFESLGPRGQETLLRQTLDYLEALPPGAPSPVERIMRTWLAGDPERLLRVSLEYVDRDDPLQARFIEALVDRRNVRMTQGIERRIRAEPERGSFFAVGALHLPGPEGLLARLAKRGFEVERVESR